MAKFGKNMKWSVDGAYRDRIRAMFVEAIGAEVAAGPHPQLDLYRFRDGFQIGVFSVDASEALRPEDLKKAPWLEFSVDDVEQTKAKLSALGVEEVAYVDKDHPYYATPGGPVFRLAKKS